MYLVTLINAEGETIINAVSPSPLAPRVTGTVKQGINCFDSFTFQIFPNNPGYPLINPLKSKVIVQNTITGKAEFTGRVLTPKASMDDDGSAYREYLCESELAYLCDSMQRYGEFHNYTPRQYLEALIAAHNAGVEADKQFVVGEVTVTDPNDSLYRYTDYKSTWQNIKEDLLDSLGGELRVRYEDGVRYLDYLAAAGETCTTEIRLGTNMRSASEDLDMSGLYTRIIPLGAKLKTTDADGNEVQTDERLTIATVNGGVDYLDYADGIAQYGIIQGTVQFDDVTTPEALLAKGQAYVAALTVTLSTEVSAYDLSLLPLDITNLPVLPLIEGTVTGETTQIRTVQGKNLLDKDRLVVGETVDTTTGTIITSTGYRSPQISVLASTQYTVSGVSVLSNHFIAFYDSNKTYISRLSGAALAIRTFTTPSNCTYLIFTQIPSGKSYTSEELYKSSKDTLQLELGSVATDYRPYVPNSPSLEYPSSLVNEVKSGRYRYWRNGEWWVVDLPYDMRSTGGVADTWNADTHEFTQRVRAKVLTGTEVIGQYISSVGGVNPCISAGILTGRKANTPALCTHDVQTSDSNGVLYGKASGIWFHTSSTYPNYMYWVVPYRLLGTSPSSTTAQNISAYNSLIAARYAAGAPVVIYYELETPIVTTITPTLANDMHPDLDSFEVGNYYPIVNPLLNIHYTSRVIAKTIKIGSPADSTLTLGQQPIDIKTYNALKQQNTQKQLQAAVSKLQAVQNSIGVIADQKVDAYDRVLDQTALLQKLVDGDYDGLYLDEHGRLFIKGTYVATGILASVQLKTGSTTEPVSWINLDDGTFSFAEGAITYDGTRVRITVGNGYTFGPDGLIIDTASSATRTVVDETGMEVQDKSGSANTRLFYAGYENERAIVETQFIEVKKYIKIGNNSRIQDYGADRTGIFYVGGD